MIPRLHVITDDAILAREDFVTRAREVLEVGGVDLALHLRGPRTSGKVLFSLARALKGPADEFGCALLANDRVDLALALSLAGVHLGQRSIPAEAARRILGRHRLLGLSVHGGEELEGVNPRDLDFLVVGTIFSSPSHPGMVPAGVHRIREIGKVFSGPLLAIGGATPERIPELLAAGAHGLCVRGGIWDKGDPSRATRVYVEELKHRRGE